MGRTPTLLFPPFGYCDGSAAFAVTHIATNNANEVLINWKMTPSSCIDSYVEEVIGVYCTDGSQTGDSVRTAATTAIATAGAGGKRRASSSPVCTKRSRRSGDQHNGAGADNHEEVDDGYLMIDEHARVRSEGGLPPFKLISLARSRLAEQNKLHDSILLDGESADVPFVVRLVQQFNDEVASFISSKLIRGKLPSVELKTREQSRTKAASVESDRISLFRSDSSESTDMDTNAGFGMKTGSLPTSFHVSENAPEILENLANPLFGDRDVSASRSVARIASYDAEASVPLGVSIHLQGQLTHVLLMQLMQALFMPNRYTVGIGSPEATTVLWHSCLGAVIMEDMPAKYRYTGDPIAMTADDVLECLIMRAEDCRSLATAKEALLDAAEALATSTTAATAAAAVASASASISGDGASAKQAIRTPTAARSALRTPSRLFTTGGANTPLTAHKYLGAGMLPQELTALLPWVAENLSYLCAYRDIVARCERRRARKMADKCALYSGVAVGGGGMQVMGADRSLLLLCNTGASVLVPASAQSELSHTVTVSSGNTELQGILDVATTVWGSTCYSASSRLPLQQVLSGLFVQSSAGGGISKTLINYSSSKPVDVVHNDSYVGVSLADGALTAMDDWFRSTVAAFKASDKQASELVAGISVGSTDAGAGAGDRMLTALLKDVRVLCAVPFGNAGNAGGSENVATAVYSHLTQLAEKLTIYGLALQLLGSSSGVDAASVGRRDLYTQLIQLYFLLSLEGRLSRVRVGDVRKSSNEPTVCFLSGGAVDRQSAVLSSRAFRQNASSDSGDAHGQGSGSTWSLLLLHVSSLQSMRGADSSAPGCGNALLSSGEMVLEFFRLCKDTSLAHTYAGILLLLQLESSDGNRPAATDFPIAGTATVSQLETALVSDYLRTAEILALFLSHTVYFPLLPGGDGCSGGDSTFVLLLQERKQQQSLLHIIRTLDSLLPSDLSVLIPVAFDGDGGGGAVDIGAIIEHWSKSSSNRCDRLKDLICYCCGCAVGGKKLATDGAAQGRYAELWCAILQVLISHLAGPAGVSSLTMDSQVNLFLRCLKTYKPIFNVLLKLQCQYDCCTALSASIVAVGEDSSSIAISVHNDTVRNLLIHVQKMSRRDLTSLHALFICQSDRCASTVHSLLSTAVLHHLYTSFEVFLLLSERTFDMSFGLELIFAMCNYGEDHTHTLTTDAFNVGSARIHQCVSALVWAMCVDSGSNAAKNGGASSSSVHIHGVCQFLCEAMPTADGCGMDTNDSTDVSKVSTGGASGPHMRALVYSHMLRELELLAFSSAVNSSAGVGGSLGDCESDRNAIASTSRYFNTLITALQYKAKHVEIARVLHLYYTSELLQCLPSDSPVLLRLKLAERCRTLSLIVTNLSLVEVPDQRFVTKRQPIRHGGGGSNSDVQSSVGLQIVTKNQVLLLLTLTSCIADHDLLGLQSSAQMLQRVNSLAMDTNDCMEVALLVVDVVSLMVSDLGSEGAVGPTRADTLTTMVDLLVRAHEFCVNSNISDHGVGTGNNRDVLRDLSDRRHVTVLEESTQMLLFVLMDLYVRETQSTGNSPEVAALLNGIHHASVGISTSVSGITSVKTTAADSLLGYISNGFVRRLEPTLVSSCMGTSWKIHCSMLIAYIEAVRTNCGYNDVHNGNDSLYGVRIPIPLLKAFNYTDAAGEVAAVPIGNSCLVELILQILLANGGELLQSCQIARQYFDQLSSLLDFACSSDSAQQTEPASTTTPTMLVDALITTCVSTIGSHVVHLLPMLLKVIGRTNKKMSSYVSLHRENPLDFMSLCESSDGVLVRDSKTSVIRLHSDLWVGLNQYANHTGDKMNPHTDHESCQHCHVLLMLCDEFVALQTAISKYYKHLYRYEVGLSASHM